MKQQRTDEHDGLGGLASGIRNPQSAIRNSSSVSISEPFIRRPIATSLLMAGVLLMGFLGYELLPISALPPVDFPTIQVVGQYPGASPDVMASSVTEPWSGNSARSAAFPR